MWFKNTQIVPESKKTTTPKTIVVALGGNALQKKGEATAEAQERVAAETATQLVSLVKAGYRLVIVHGNGPQVGNIILHEEAVNTLDVPTLPLDSAVAMSQGLIGYWLQKALNNELATAGIENQVVSIVTQAVVDTNDPAFQNPTKPIGPFYETEAEARHIANERKFQVKEDAGRGWRRVVPSPLPIDIIEKDTIQDLSNSGAIVIAAGGGGVPVVATEQGYLGMEAVIDKDAAAAVLADALEAETLLVLTSVDAVMLRYGKTDQQALHHVGKSELRQYIEQGEFAAGSMLPKVEAALRFVDSHPGRQAIIASLANADAAVRGTNGTIIRS